MANKAEDELNFIFNQQQLKKQVFNICINAAITKAKLLATLLPVEVIEDIIKQLESFKK